MLRSSGFVFVFFRQIARQSLMTCGSLRTILNKTLIKLVANLWLRYSKHLSGIESMISAQREYGRTTDISKAWLKNPEQAVEALLKLAPEVKFFNSILPPPPLFLPFYLFFPFHTFWSFPSCPVPPFSISNFYVTCLKLDVEILVSLFCLIT